ncbi:ribonuclease Z [Dokdonia sp. 4H-3-7-5]|uniref:ribonuclease Z n=1 Tax=Dokdonia sp. (strain 4H-3-7-5) TaxID=983548 RepID=UPI00020A735F|nr:ribonuclease Z [Dokdonia sp. 4H-3-7-5]AEE20835.1 ribonuclease Z [Dokdonia sp. 4H-3-7-5]
MSSNLHLTILGCYAAAPSSFKNPTSQVLDIRNHLFLIDCGEGTQVALRRNKIKFSRIKHIFISHLHGDHFFGLMGVITTFSLLKRTAPLTIYGPKGLKEIILLQLKITQGFTSYPLQFVEITSKEPTVIYEDDEVMVTTIPLKHRIYTNGFYFQEKPGERKLDINACLNYEIDKAYYSKIKQGGDITLDDGTLIPNDKLTFDPSKPKSYAYCSDTAYKEPIATQIKGATVLYHEATFLESHAHLCKPTGHSTAAQAAQIAEKAEVESLVLGHYSIRYGDLNLFAEEARPHFENVLLGDDGKEFTF